MYKKTNIISKEVEKRDILNKRPVRKFEKRWVL